MNKICRICCNPINVLNVWYCKDCYMLPDKRKSKMFVSMYEKNY